MVAPEQGQSITDEAVGPEGSPSSSEQNLARLRDQQNRYLPHMMRLCATAHPYYRKVFKEHGLAPEDFETVEDIAKLPLLRKQDYIGDPEMFRLNLDNVPDLAPEETTLADIIYTAGSTGRPTPFYDTVHDRFTRIHHSRRGALIAGIGPEDTVMNLFPLTSVPHAGFPNAMWGAMSAGAKLLTGLTGRSYPEIPIHNRMDHAIEMIEMGRATVLWGITTYVRRLVIRAQELGKDFSSVRLAMVMGEACPAEMREDVRLRLKELGCEEPMINNGYGFTEMQGPSIECVEFGGTHKPDPEQYYFEVIHPDAGSPVPDGEKGMLVVSHLNRRGTVLLRYVVGDMVALTHETCPHCGRWEPRFLGSPYRADGLTKVKGTLINPASLHDELAQLLHRGVAEWQVVITRENSQDRFSPDAVLIRLACAPENRERVTLEAKSLVKRAVEITPIVEFLPVDGFSEIARGYKFKRFVDER